MARPWRLRHKLGLGLALVVGSVVLLLAGAIFGLSSYVETMHVTQRKLDEMQIVVLLRDAVHQIASPTQTARLDPALTQYEAEKKQVEDASRAGRDLLRAYRVTVEEGAADPTEAADGLERIDRLDKLFLNLDDAIARAAGGRINSVTPDRIVDDPAVKAAHDKLTRSANELFLSLVGDAKKSFDRSSANHRRSLAVAGSAAVLAVVLVLALMYYFRVWVFKPIHRIQAGVQRVHNGDFDHPIAIESDDELAELAAEFNAMTTRMRDVYGDLARQVNERTRQLVRSERMVSVGFLAAGVAHEINNPLASIAFCAEALESRLAGVLAKMPADADVIQKYLRMMQEEAQRCKEITHKLLDFSRSGGKREPADVTALVRDVIEVAKVLPAARGKRIDFRHDGSVIAPVRVPEVKGVVLNVLVNGLESMEDGGVLTASVATRGDAVELTFADAGCGMTAEVLEHIFEPFFTRSRTGNGTGLGLATSHLIIDQHGGTISAASAGPGKGSTFTVRLPLRATTANDGDKSDPPMLPFPGRRLVAA